MSSQEHERDRGRGRGKSTGRGKGRGRGVQSVEDDTLQNIRAARQVTQRQVACLSAQQKKELIQLKRKKELHRIILPDAPPRKRRMQKESPDREPFEMVAPPLPSTSAAVDSVTRSPARLGLRDAGSPLPVAFEFNFEESDGSGGGTPDADTVPNSPSSLDSLVLRLPTSQFSEVVCRTPRKRELLNKEYTDSDDSC